MAVNLLIKKADFDALDAKLQAEYKPVAGKEDEYELDVVGGNPNARITDFRNRNILLDKELKTEREKWEGLGDPEEVKAVWTKADEIKKGEVYKKGSQEFEKEIEKRTGAMKTDLEGKAKAAEDKALALQSRLETLEIHDALVREAGALNVLPDALNDFVSSQRACIKLENGQPVVYEPDGRTQVYGADSKPITIKEHVANLAKQKPWFFKPSQGAGSQGGNAGGGGGGADDGANPWDPKYSGADKTTRKQAMMGSDDPAVKAKAKRMAAQHGVILTI